MVNYWLIRAGENGELWDEWAEKEVLTIGWDIGEITENPPSWDEMKDEIDEQHSPDDPGGTTGMVRRFAGIRDSASENLEEGDIAIVEGNATVAGIAVIGEYRYESEGLPETQSHTYWRDVDYLHKGPVRIRDLPSRFQQGNKDSLHLIPTLKKYKSGNEDTLEDLIQALDNAEEVQQTAGFLDFSEASIQSYLGNNLDELLSGVSEFEREYSTRAGNADFVCEMDHSETVVIETKIGTADHSAVSQLMSYMNSIRADQDQDVRGLVVAEDFSPKAKLASESDDVELYRFEAMLQFQDVSV